MRLEKKIASLFNRPERFVFFLAALASLIPLFLLRYHGSLDGPKHLTASNIIGQLLLNNPLFTGLFKLNSFYTGNTLGIWLLAIFNLILPAWLAEKMFLATYLLGFAFSFRYLLQSWQPKPGLFSLIVFPFAHSSLFLMGYYNFSLALAGLFLSFGYWMRHHATFTLRTGMLFALLLLLTYLTHVFVFYILLMIIGLYALQLLLASRLNAAASSREFWRMACKTLLAALPSLVLSVFYLRDILAFQQSDGWRQAQANKWHDFTHFRMLVGFDPKTELPVYQWIFYLMLAATLTAFALRLTAAFKKKKGAGASFFRETDRIFLIFIVLLGLYFYLPDGADAAGSVGVRLLIIATLMWGLWLAAQSWPKYLAVVPLLLLSYTTFETQKIHHHFLKPLDAYIRQVEGFEKKIPSGSRVVTMNFSKNWLMHYFHNYIGMENRIVDLRGNSASRFMAFDWRNGSPDVLNHLAQAEGLNAGLDASSNWQTANWVVVFEYRQFIQEDTQQGLRQALETWYQQVEVSDNGLIALYKHKKMQP